MKKNYLAILLVLFGITAEAQENYAEWAHLIEGGLNTSINNVVTDGDYVYINGTYTGNTIEFLGTPLPFAVSSNIVVAKLDADGNVVWLNTITGNSIDSFFDLKLDGAGNLVATGWSSSQDDLLLNEEEVLLEGDDMWTNKGLVAKFSGETGELIWFRGWASEEFGSANPIRLTTDTNNNIYVAGYYTSDFSIDDLEFTFNKMFGEDVFLIKFNEDGETVWGNTIETIDNGGWSRTKSITANSEGVYHLFEYNQELNINGETVPFPGTAYWLCIAKSDFETGDVTDYTYFGSATGWQTVNQIVTDNDDNLMLTGYFTDDTGFEIDGTAPAGYGDEDAFVAKMTPDFDLDWIKTIGGTHSDRGFNLFVRPTGEILVGGGYGSTSVLNYDGEEIISTTTIASSVSSAFQLYLDQDGNYQTHFALFGYSVETSVSNNSTVVLNDNSVITGGRFVGLTVFLEGIPESIEHLKGFVMKWEEAFAPLVQDVIVTTQDEVPAEIVGIGNTLQLIATINPTEASQEVTWSVENGAEFGSVDENGLVTALAVGVVTVRATSVEDNTKYDEIDVVISILDPCLGVTAPEGESAQTLTEGQTLADVTVSGENLQWYSDEALTTPIPSSTVIVNGTVYYVTQTVGECESDALAVTINLVTGINDLAQLQIKFYPNPVENILNLSFNRAVSNVSIYGLLGELVYSKSINRMQAQLNLSDLASGIYLVKVEAEGKVETFKVVKK